MTTEVTVIPFEGYELKSWELRSNPDQEGTVKIKGVEFKTSWPTEVEVGNHLVYNSLTLGEVEDVRPKDRTTWIKTRVMDHIRPEKLYDTEHDNQAWVVILEKQAEDVQMEVKLDAKVKILADKLVKESIAEAEAKGEPWIKPQRFRHKETGEIVTTINLMEIKNYEKLDD